MSQEETCPKGLKLEVLKAAARIVGSHHPLTVTSAAATRVLSIRDDGHSVPRHGAHEDSAALADLIGALREIIRKDPDDACRWAPVLKDVLRAHETLADPTKWKPSAEQKARAAAALQCGEDQVADIRFDSDGRLLARKLYENFIEIPVTAESCGA